MSNISRYGQNVRRTFGEAISSLNDQRRKVAWRLTNRSPSETVPVFIVGSQRSGTTMLGECLGRSPEIENFGETDRRAFLHFFLRNDETIREVVRKNPYRVVIFKPLKDSHRVRQLLALHPRSKSVWAYRHFADRINSAVRKFGRHPLDVFSTFKKGHGKSWQLEGLSEDDERLINSLDLDALSEGDGAALMWYIRNSLFFNQKLEEVDRVLLLSYDDFVARPDVSMTALTDFLGAHYYPFMVRSVHNRSLSKNPRPILDPYIENLCESLYDRLESVRKARHRRSIELKL